MKVITAVRQKRINVITEGIQEDQSEWCVDDKKNATPYILILIHRVSHVQRKRQT